MVSTVMAPSRERVHMLSWVAMERIYEREILPDPKLHKEAVPRPLRADARRLTDGAPGLRFAKRGCGVFVPMMSC